MNKSLYLIFIVIISTSCSDNFNELEGKRFDLSITPQLNDSLIFELEDYFIKNENRLNWLDFSKIHGLRLDSNYFSYQIYLAVSDKEDSLWVAWLNPVTELISTELMHEVPVHIFVTDRNFNVLQRIPYTTDYLLPGHQTFRFDKVIMTVDELLVPNAFANGLEELLNRVDPRILDNQDSTRINASLKNERVLIDLTLRKDQLNIEELNNQLSQVDPLIFNLLLNYRSGTINFRDSENEEVFKVVMIK